MVVTSAHDCTSAYVYPPSGSAPSGLPRCARLDPSSLRKPKFRCAPFSLTSLAASRCSAKCHLVPRCHRSLPLACRGYFRSFLAPITHVNLRSRFASTSRSFGRILPRSSVGWPRWRSAQSASFFGTIAFAPMIKICLPLLFWRLRGRHYFFEIADVTVGYARVLSE
jgi:hypothetical protein